MRKNVTKGKYERKLHVHSMYSQLMVHVLATKSGFAQDISKTIMVFMTPLPLRTNNSRRSLYWFKMHCFFLP